MFAVFALGDVIEDGADLTTARAADARSVSRVPTPRCLIVIFNALRFARPRHFVINFEPVAFGVRGNLAAELTHRVFKSRLPLEDRIDFQITIINRPSVFTVNQLEKAKALVNRIEQRAVFFFPFSQRCFGTSAFDRRPCPLGDFYHQLRFKIRPISRRALRDAKISDKPVLLHHRHVDKGNYFHLNAELS